MEKDPLSNQELINDRIQYVIRYGKLDYNEQYYNALTERRLASYDSFIDNLSPNIIFDLNFGDTFNQIESLIKREFLSSDLCDFNNYLIRLELVVNDIQQYIKGKKDFFLNYDDETTFYNLFEKKINELSETISKFKTEAETSLLRN